MESTNLISGTDLKTSLKNLPIDIQPLSTRSDFQNSRFGISNTSSSMMFGSGKNFSTKHSINFKSSNDMKESYLKSNFAEFDKEIEFEKQKMEFKARIQTLEFEKENLERSLASTQKRLETRD